VFLISQINQNKKYLTKKRFVALKKKIFNINIRNTSTITSNRKSSL